MLEDAPKNIDQLIEYLKTLPPETEFVTEVNVFEWKLCTWKPQIKRLVRDGYQEKTLTIPYVGHDAADIVNVIEIG